ncbi:hypothetical protein [Aquipuribacter sp. MA13-6]|uniref:hypothetical protein n=1 Tax=unclassified Aquipuribacter TaxID=2635084 RepID=UPI003EED65B9
MTPPPPAPARPPRPRLSRDLVAAASLLLGAVVAVSVVLVPASASGPSGHGGGHRTYEGMYLPPQADRATPAVSSAFRQVPAGSRHEVWLVDQSDTARTPAGAGYGGRLHVYRGDALRGRSGIARAQVVDLSGQTAELCLTSTGSYPVRPHMLSFAADDTHAVLAFVVSGHTVILDAERRRALACFRSEVGAGGARQAHASVPTPDDRYVVVANQNGKKLERISTDYARGVFRAEPEATLDLTAGSTPNGVPLQTPDDPRVRPDNAPICPFVPSTGFPAYVSLRGGGLLTVDPYATPMTVVGEWPATEVARDGCGFTESAGWVYGNGGSNPNNLGGWFHYRVPVGDRDTYSADNPPGTPAVQVVDRDTRGPRDAHGVATVGEHVWGFDRAAHVVQVWRGEDAAPVTTVDLRTDRSATPAADIADVSPDGRAVYVATRGPNPLSGAHAAVGDAPGLLVLEARDDGAQPVVRTQVGISNVVDGVERADPHGVAVRRLG